MTGQPLPASLRQTADPYLERIRELERQLEESEETLDAIRRGDIDAVVVNDAVSATHRIYTLENADHPYRVLIEQIQEGAVTLGPDGAIFYCNRRLAEMLRAPQERVTGQPLSHFIRPDDQGAFERLLRDANQGAARAELTLRAADGAHMPVCLSLSLLQREREAPLLCGLLADLTQQRLHLQELSEANARLVAESAQRAAAEDALRQSQKMEAVGQLTGGLAHDFNNLLTGIAGSLQLMRARMAQGRTAGLDRYIAAALSSSDRAAALTHRLLAFSRRQTLDPKLVEANRLLAGMEELLLRTIGPAIALRTVPAADVGLTLCDPNQLENALLNLAINARDAMPNGGQLTIETANIDLEPAFAAARDMRPGRYVAISVTDTGAGMAPEVAARAFDPFFTTKPIGMGTGLGLSMIYGFAKQSGGQVRIHSEPGLGATVRLYLPRIPGVAEAARQEETAQSIPRASPGKTVVVVDDEPVVRMLVAEVLQELGYAALEAGDGPAALRALQGAGEIALLVTDVGLPGGMNGRQLADAVRRSRPGLKTLFITGFAETAAVGNGTMEPGMEVMTKPFAMDALAAKIQAMIND